MEYVLIMSSELFGEDKFRYDTLEEAKAGQERIERKIAELNDGVKREFSIEVED